MTRALGNMLLWLAPHVGRLGFKLRDADVTDAYCCLTLVPTPEKQRAEREAFWRSFDAALASTIGSSVDGVCTDERVNTVPNRDTN